MYAETCENNCIVLLGVGSVGVPCAAEWGIQGYGDGKSKLLATAGSRQITLSCLRNAEFKQVPGNEVCLCRGVYVRIYVYIYTYAFTCM